MTNQEQPPLDLAEGERLLKKDAGDIIAGNDGSLTEYGEWLADNGEALVDALKAACGCTRGADGIIDDECIDHHAVRHNWLDERNKSQQLRGDLQAAQKQYQIACDLVEQTEAERDALRADLVRVKADYALIADGYAKMAGLAGKYERENERLQARIAELEGSLRDVYETHGRVDDGPCWCGDCERARSNLPAQTPSAS